MANHIRLEYRMKKGESLTYRTRIDTEQEINVEGEHAKTSSHVDMKMVHRCTDVAPDGTITADLVVESGTMTQEETIQPLPNIGETLTVWMKKNGQIIRTSTPLPFEQTAFPEGAVKLGQSWTSKSKISIPGKQGMAELLYNYTLSRFEKIMGYDCGVIEVSCGETVIPLENGIEEVIKAEGTTYFAYGEGRMVQSEIETLTLITTPDGEMETALLVRVDLV